MVNSGIPKQRCFRSMASDQSCQELLANLNPTLCPDPWVFTLVAGAAPQLPEDHSVFALIREEEGLTAIRRAAPSDNPETLPLFARITLQVYSDLEAVGLTAAVSGYWLSRTSVPISLPGLTTITCLYPTGGATKLCSA